MTITTLQQALNHFLIHEIAEPVIIGNVIAVSFTEAERMLNGTHN
jgi:hypothetical protein